MKRAFNSMLAILMLFIAACSTVGVTEPTSFDQRLAYAASQVTATRQVAADLYERGQISKADAQEILKATDQAWLLVQASRGFNAEGDHTRAETALRTATEILTVIETYLKGIDK